MPFVRLKARENDSWYFNISTIEVVRPQDSGRGSWLFTSGRTTPWEILNAPQEVYDLIWHEEHDAEAAGDDAAQLSGAA